MRANQEMTTLLDKHKHCFCFHTEGRCCCCGETKPYTVPVSEFLTHLEVFGEEVGSWERFDGERLIGKIGRED